jgi:parvulin-like peptidyl-prolyl isomerase
MIRTCGLLFCALTLIVAGCRRQPEKKIIARVGNSVLTQEEAKAWIDTTMTPYNDRMKAYAGKWVEDEIFYQEALGKGLQNAEQFKKQMKELGRQITIQNFLRQEIYSDTMQVADDALQQYFTVHQSEFYVREDIVRLNFITFSERKPAVTFVAALNAGRPWADVVKGASFDTSLTNKIVGKEENKLYTQKTLYPTELWRVASILNTGEVSFPVKTSLGYSILQVLSKLKSGSPATIDAVYDEVKMRLIIEERRARYDSLISRLRSKYHVEIFGSPEKETDSAQKPFQ